MTSYWYTKFLMPVPRRYFRLAELNGDSNPQRGCNISFYSTYTFVINTNNAAIRRKFSLLRYQPVAMVRVQKSSARDNKEWIYENTRRIIGVPDE